LLVIVAGLALWVTLPDSGVSHVMEIAAGTAAAIRLARWRGLATLREPLLCVLHVGYGWLALGLAFLRLNALMDWPGPGAPLHALTVGAIGTMTAAVMTRASLGHSGRPLAAGRGTVAIYLLITIAAVLRVAAPATAYAVYLTSFAGLAWSAAFVLFA